ncbi:hypothetical protein [Psychromonas sp.]|uniref:hypothetical protein n=1 Tax=Psychromonas sp. TaxID=1884585 RepID=UPI003567B6CF
MARAAFLLVTFLWLCKEKQHAVKGGIPTIKVKPLAIKRKHATKPILLQAKSCKVVNRLGNSNHQLIAAEKKEG